MNVDEILDYWYEKQVYSPLFDKVFEVTSIDFDEWDRPMLYCEEKIADGVYDKPETFYLFEIREL